MQPAFSQGRKWSQRSLVMVLLLVMSTLALAEDAEHLSAIRGVVFDYFDGINEVLFIV